MAITEGDRMSTAEIVVLVAAAFVLGFVVGRVVNLRRNAG
jgi:hypothetical protein